jgi:hypothetical protein
MGPCEDASWEHNKAASTSRTRYRGYVKRDRVKLGTTYLNKQRI